MVMRSFRVRVVKVTRTISAACTKKLNDDFATAAALLHWTLAGWLAGWWQESSPPGP